MLISDLLGQYYNSTRNGEGKKVGDTSGARAVQKLVSSLRDMGAGTIFEGTVNSMEGGKVMLGLSNGQQIAARLDGSIQLNVGQSMFFQVKTNDGAQIAIRPFTVDGNRVNLTLMNALAAAKLPATGENLSMVNKMMEEQMPIDAASLGKMARLFNANPEINVQTLVQMQKFGIPINKEMAAQFENYMDDKQAITKAVDSFIDELPQVMADENAGAGELRNMNAKVLSIITDGLSEAEAQPAGTLSEENAGVNAGKEEVLQQTENFNTTIGEEPADGSGAAKNTQAGVQENAAMAENPSVQEENGAGKNAVQENAGGTENPSVKGESAGTAKTAQAGAAENLSADAAKTMQGDAEAAQAGTGRAENLSAQGGAEAAKTAQAGVTGDLSAQGGAETAQAGAGGKAVGENGAGAVRTPAQESSAGTAEMRSQESAGKPDVNASALAGRESMEHSLGSLLSGKQLQTLESQLKEFPGVRDHAELFKDGKLNPNADGAELLKVLRDALQSDSPIAKQTLTKLFGGKAFAAVLKDTLEQQWMVKPQDVAKDGGKVNALYEKLEQQMSRMEQVVRATGHEHPEFSQAAGEVRSNVDFMNHLNNAYTYVQIPLKMSGQNASGELFVYTNKKNLAQQGDRELTAFLHLDLDHLGSTDVSVRMKKKDVSTDFYLEDDASYALVKAHLPELEARLKRLGYQCQFSVTNENRKVNFVEDFLKKDQPSAGQQLHRYSFDMRA